MLEAQGESEAIKIIDVQLRENPRYLEWLKTQRWDGVLPLVTGGTEGATPFIQIPSERSDGAVQEAATPTAGSNGTSASTQRPTGTTTAGNSTQPTR